MAYLLGTAPNQVPTNSDLGKLAFMDEVNSVSNNPWMNTDISDVKPSLLLDFANSKTLDPRITYSRASTATYTDFDGLIKTAAAGIPRFDHDPITGESKGFLVEEQRSNLALRSQEFDNSAWTKTRSSVIADTVVAPDGTLTADKIVEDSTATNTHFVQNTGAITVTNATAYTVSVFAKAGERSLLRINLQGATNAPAFYNLATGTLGSIGAGVTASISAAGNGWYRCVFTRTIDSTLANVILNIADAGEAVTYTGNGYSGLYIWGAQVEAGSFPTSYIPTTSSQVTRSADAASMTGTNFSSWYNQAEGTLYTESQLPSLQTAGSPRIASLSDNSNNNELSCLYNLSASNLGFNAKVSGSFVALLTQSVGSANLASLAKCIGSYKTDNFGLSVNGSNVSTDQSGSLPTVNRLNLGCGPVDISGSQGINGTIKKLAYYPVRLSNNELQEMTE